MSAVAEESIRSPQARVSAPLLDERRLAKISADAFRGADPYPWINPESLLTQAGFDLLRFNMPPLEVMKPSFGRRRAHGQQPHDRYALEYRPELPLHPAWHRLVEELHGPRYQRFLSRLFDSRRFTLSCHWHYTPRGCSVSPHCDARRKLGSHIFYFNTTEDWQPDWGGETLVLDDGGRLSRNSAPAFDDFDRAFAANAIGNRSLLFRRRGNSWHGVRTLNCPRDRMRKVFIVAVNGSGPLARLRRLLHRPDGY